VKRLVESNQVSRFEGAPELSPASSTRWKMALINPDDSDKEVMLNLRTRNASVPLAAAGNLRDRQAGRLRSLLVDLSIHSALFFHDYQK
jgi:hypothetical protein